VADTGNAPIQGATVAAVSVSGSTVSNASGQYDLVGLNPGFSNVSVTAFGFDPLQVSVTINPGPAVTSQNFMLQKGSAVITGTVQSGNFGGPLRATISILGTSFQQPLSTTEADAAGNYSFANVPSGQIIVTATARGYISQRSVVQLGANQTVNLDFSLFLVKPPPPPPGGRV
jgi:hypothetical protein